MSPRSSSPASASDTNRASGFAEGVLRVRPASGRSDSARDATREHDRRAADESVSVSVSGAPLRARSVHPADLMILERAARSIRLRTR